MAKDNRNMKRLKDEQQVRQRAGVIFGTNDEFGAAHGVEEVIANSVDEAREGHGDEIIVKFDEDGSVTVTDHGRGLPMDWNEDEGMWNWELALCTLYASGKYDNSQYGDSTGLNGLGLTATQFASEYMDVWSTYGGKTRYMHFEKGKPVGQMKIGPSIIEGTGTTIKFKPDPEVFPALRVRGLPAAYFIELARKQAIVLDGITIKLDHFEVGQELVLCYPNGIVDFIKSIVEKTLIKDVEDYKAFEYGVDEETPELPKYKVDMRLAFTFSRDQNFLEVYHNGSQLFEAKDNYTVDGLKDAFTSAFTDYSKMNGKIGRNDKFLYKDIEPLLVCVAKTSAPGNRTWFKNQTKGAILNSFIRKSFKLFVYNSVMNWLNKNKTESDKIVAEVILNKQNREEFTKSLAKAVKTMSKGISFGNKPAKFKECASKDKRRREIYIVEGDSALGSVLLARDKDFQAVMPLRGKPINALKEKLSRVLSNDIIIDLFRIFECGMEVKHENIEGLPEFKLENLAWDKIIICTDADVDGMHIRCLCITMFYILAPSLLKAGKVYIAETPLYEITWKKENRFAFTDAEKEQVLDELRVMGAKDNQIMIQRSKGLGENDPDMMHVSTMNPLTRRLTKVEYPADDRNVANYFNALLGDDIETRRYMIEQFFEMTEIVE